MGKRTGPGGVHPPDGRGQRQPAPAAAPESGPGASGGGDGAPEAGPVFIL